MVELNSPNDFKWYKAKLDVDQKEEHKHIGEPKSYPCKVVSEYDPDDPGCVRRGSYPSYTHRFCYLQKKTCENCGHSHFEWTQIPEPE